MQLNEPQRKRVSRYLRDVESHLGRLPQERRVRALDTVNGRITRDLEQITGTVEDDHVEKILTKYGGPESLAASLVARESAREPKRLVREPSTRRIWLGVCAGLARRLSVDPFLLRVVLVVLGLIPFLLPFLLSGYLGLYFWEYFSNEDSSKEERVDWIRFGKSVGSAFAIALGLDLGMRLILMVVTKGIETFTELTPTVDPRLGWIATDGSGLFWWTVLIIVPIAALAGLPLAPKWPSTLKKVVHAGLMVYAVLLCFGIASFTAGVLIAWAGQLNGRPGADALFSVLH